MYVTIAYGAHQPTTVYGPIEDRHPPAMNRQAQAAINTPLHAAGAVTDITSVLPRVARVSHRAIAAIANATPAAGHAGPVALLLVNPDSRLLIAVGPFATAALTDRWRRERTDLPSSGIRCIPLVLATPANRTRGDR